jgi:hypothetical protein
MTTVFCCVLVVSCTWSTVQQYLGCTCPKLPHPFVLCHTLTHQERRQQYRKQVASNRNMNSRLETVRTVCGPCMQPEPGGGGTYVTPRPLAPVPCRPHGCAPNRSTGPSPFGWLYISGYVIMSCLLILVPLPPCT